MLEKLYLSDLEPGQLYKSREYLVTAEEIKTFAQQFDPQPFHLDEEAAKSTFFQGLSASGWHTGAITMRLLVDSLPIAGGLIGAGLEDFRWLKPVRPNDTLWVESEILSCRVSQSKPHQGLVKLRHKTLNQLGEPIQSFISTIVVPQKPGVQKALSPESCPTP